MRSVLALGFSLLAGCAGVTHVSDNEACIVKLNVPQQFANCFGVYDVVYRYRNSPKPADGRVYHTIYSPAVVSSYVPQQGRFHCYAAALSTGFGALGVRYPQESFASAISQECFGTQDAPLTFSQIIFSATRAHAPPGIWYADLDGSATAIMMNRHADSLAVAKAIPPVLPGRSPRSTLPIVSGVMRCQGSRGGSSSAWARVSWDLDGWIARRIGMQLPPAMPDLTPPPENDALSQLDLYRPVTWHFRDQPPNTVSGSIVPIRDSGHLIDEFFNGRSIIAGLETAGSGHVVVINRLHVVVVETGPRTVTRHPSGYIEWVEFADPQAPDKPLRTMSGDEFMATSRFLFGIHQLSRK